MEQISPTRTELLTRLVQVRLARQGADLLRAKREALMREFLSELSAFSETRSAMNKAMVEAVQALINALAVDGRESAASVALACRRPINLTVQRKNIWGIRVVDVTSDYAVRTPSQRGYTPVGVSARLDETAERFEAALDLILRLAPLDLKLRALAEGIRKTSRRVNALEQRLLPKLDEQIRFIRNVLDQREREDIFRLKMLKHKNAARP